jgi:hypothetical protein
MATKHPILPSISFTSGTTLAEILAEKMEQRICGKNW